MGGRASKSSRGQGVEANAAWGRVKDVPLYTDEYDFEEKQQEFEEEFVVEEYNWPRSCPVLHLDIKNDFILNAQKKLVLSLYRFWLYIFWIGVLNFIAVMATQLTANITSGSQLVLAFLFTVVVLFVVFFAYFRALYWAIRLHSNVLFAWFYVMSVVMWAYYGYVIVIAISLMSILAEPLSPGTQLPVKINPIFPMVMFTLVVAFHLMAIVYGFHYFAQAFKWHRTTDDEVYELLRKQRKQGWLKRWSKRGGDDPDYDDGGNDTQYKCILQYERMDEEGNDVDANNKKKKKKKGKKQETEVLAVPGALSFDDKDSKGYFATFQAEEAVFSYVFSLKIWLQNVNAVKKEGEDIIKIVESVNSQVPDEFGTEFKIVRVITLDFNTKSERDKCYKDLRKKWRAARKTKGTETSEETLENLRIGLLRRSAERSAKHLLTIRDWQELLKFAWKKEYKAGDVIMENGQYFQSLMHVSKGRVDIYLETSSKTETGSLPDESNREEEVAEVLFPGMRSAGDIAEAQTAKLSTKQELDAIRANTDLSYKVTFEKREKDMFGYEIKEIVKKGQPTKIVAAVTRVNNWSQAGKAHVRAGDYVRKIELFDVDKNIEILFASAESGAREEIRRRIDGALRAFPCPFTVEFYRPPAALPPSDADLDLYGYADDENIEVVVVGDEKDGQQQSFSFPSTTSLNDEVETYTTEMTTLHGPSDNAAVELEMAERLAGEEEVEDETVAFLAHNESGEDEQITHQPSNFVRQAQRLTRLGRGPGKPKYAAVSPSEEGKDDPKRKNIFDKGSALLFGMTSFTGVATRTKRAAADEDSVYQPVADDDGDSFTSGEESEGDGLERLFAGAATFENVGQIQKGDTIGLLPWIVNHNVSVVQLVAHSDVTIHSIDINDVLAVLRKDPILAIGFFKYVASVVGERADRDEVELCKQLLEGTAMAQGGAHPDKLCRLLDNKPIALTTKTYFEQRASWLKELKKTFHYDEDLDFDSVTDKIPGVRAYVSQSSPGGKKESQNKEDMFVQGTLYITMYYICFRPSTRSRAQEKKLHLNDIYDLRQDESLLVVATDRERFELQFNEKPVCAYVRDLIRVLSETKSVEQAPLSYTLPGDYVLRESGFGETNEVLSSLYEQQRGLRADLLVLMNTLEGVLTKQDKVKLFRDGQSVTLKRNQNVTSAITSLREVTTDDPNGLYLLGSGELVVQREIRGRRVQFASYTSHTVFGIERFLTGAPSPTTVKVKSKTATLKFAPYERCMAVLRNDPPLAARFYQYCTLTYMKRLRGPVLSRPANEADVALSKVEHVGKRGCAIL